MVYLKYLSMCGMLPAIATFADQGHCHQYRHAHYHIGKGGVYQRCCQKGAMVHLVSSLEDQSNSTLSDDRGEYLFEVPLNAEYTVSAEYVGDYLEGVSTLDLVLIQRHILDLQRHDNVYKMIASDANNDGKITASDLVELRKLILGVTNTFNNKSWRLPKSFRILT